VGVANLRKWCALTVGAVSSIVLAGSGAAGAGVQAVACGATLTADTTLTSDLTCPGNLPALTLANGVTLDLGGHTVSGSGPGGGFGINGASYTLRNGTITNFGHAVETAFGTATLSRVRLVVNGMGVESLGSQVKITNSVIDRNGVGLGGDTPGFFADDTTIDGNGTGVTTFQGGFIGNRDSISNNQVDGIRINQGVISLADSRVNGNNGFGVWVFNSYQSPIARLIGNTASQNGADGIFVTQLVPLSFPNQWYVAHNTANQNHGYGIEIENQDGAITGYDKGGNVASGNGQPAQCLGLACSPG
jgi:hypothetical protein